MIGRLSRHYVINKNSLKYSSSIYQERYKATKTKVKSTSPDKESKLSKKLKKAVKTLYDSDLFYSDAGANSKRGEFANEPMKTNENIKFDNLEEDKPVNEKKNLPIEVKYFDTAKIYVKSGDGGDGCVAFNREKFNAHGGPSGGDGGRGGNVWAIVDKNLNSLLTFRQKIHYRATNGTSGKGSNLKGSNGKDVYVNVPPGTIIRMADEEEEASSVPLAELFKEGDKALLIMGGLGGRGNASFKTSMNNVPTISEKGAKGKEIWLNLELKLVADIGIIGIPNAGKSTLLASISAAKPKIANYPFTTLVPNLGVCDMDYESTVFADVPGLLEGASRGIGLGHEFLRHCMRCKVLVHIIDGTSIDPIGDYEAIQLELELFSPELKNKPQVIAYNKIDLDSVDEMWPDVKECLLEKNILEENMFPISAMTKKGMAPVVRRSRELLAEVNKNEIKDETTDALNITVAKDEVDRALITDFVIEQHKDVTPTFWIVRGKGIERFTQMTNWEYYEAARRFQRVLDRSGISDSLRERGIKDGDEVSIGEMVFEWNNDRSEKFLYGSYLEGWKEAKAKKGTSKWPHPV